MTDAPFLPMPELETPPLRTYEVTWVMRGTLTIYAHSEAIARADAARNRHPSLALLSDAIEVEMSEPKEVAGE
jgi:hypothetical protein